MRCGGCGVGRGHRNSVIACCSRSSGRWLSFLTAAILQGALQDAPGLTGQALGGLPQQLEAGVSEQGVRAAGGFEGVLDELGEALAFQHRLQMHAHLDAAGQRGVRSPL